MQTVETRHAVHPDHVRSMDTTALRDHFLAPGLFAAGEIRLCYTHYDRMVIGGVVPDGKALTLETVEETRTATFLERREMGVVNIGGAGSVTADGTTHEMKRGDVLYLGMGTGPVSFAGQGRFYVASAPAHRSCPTALVTVEGAREVTMGAAETSNKRTIRQFIHPEVIDSCQLTLGYTALEAGSVWNTIPSHVHDRRMEAYLYWGMDDEARVLHLMGEPQETRHLFVANEQAVISPPWSIHSGAGIGEYTFIWCMAGDNKDFTDMDFVQPKEMR
ncbi:5-dehydro-4-deoxy-D-glucuronate isomerase [Roseivivax sediminis]|uniref:4-deoxy-L-threo-5-hexosulose-uronate ketol-isomerase n=1 Tax=Roseivivax sediminis TaxID=936889 RepID=A0A1I2C373_9RHOB|nr:5-dehydro-4-deoxy-D-glucuronate isomerase [Roseivivax sediminis]SFE62602.1 4-deoxy-L-threo-5-hexosulose-uronate ketol-isomerase [Roseivivax sediminis]